MHTTAASDELNKTIINYYNCLANVLSDADIRIAPFLEREQLPASTSNLANHQHSLEQFYRVIKDVLNTTNIDGLGLKFGSQMKLTDYGILGFALLSCATILEAANYISKFITMTTDQVSINHRFDKSSAIIQFSDNSPLFWAQPFLLEESLAESWSVIKILLPELSNEHPTKIHLSYPKPTYAKLYNDFFQCPVYYNQPVTELWLPQKWFEKPINTANQITSEVCSQQCELIVNQLNEQGDIVDQVRRLLLTNPMTTMLRLEDAAEKLNLSPRTLREHLYQADTNYKEIVTELRMQIAKEYLTASSLTTQEVAYLTGYQHSSNFFRAFKKSIGITPEQFREDMVG
jgi:AraC-like DNA-binding protein